MRVRLVEDDANARDVSSRLLEFDGHDVVAADPAAATEAIDARMFDVPLIDIELGPLDGFTVLAHLRNRQPGTRAVIMTAYDVPDIGRRNQADGFLATPHAWSDVRAAIAPRPLERRVS